MQPPDFHAANLRGKFGLVTADELADILDVTTNTLQVWRISGCGPKFVKLGKSVFYRAPDIQEWIDARVHKNTDNELVMHAGLAE